VRARPTPGVLVKACLNGSRRRTEHEALPISAQELALDAARAVGAGAGALHVHPRLADGTETLGADPIGRAIAEIRTACPGTPVGLSTGAWIERDPRRRLAQVESWITLPDFVSVNFSEPGAVDLCERLIDRRIGVEAGLWTVGDADLLARSSLAGRCLRVLIEPREEDTDQAMKTAGAIETRLDENHLRLPRLLHGTGRAAWVVLGLALKRGYDIRIGFEDTLRLPDGRLATNNADLVAAAIRLVIEHGYTPRPPVTNQ
jgi:uncharacterized protein (DUF849 family)